MNPLEAVYAGAARFRRQWYARHPGAQRRLGVPVISVGNLVAGGSGKTPLVAFIAERLLEAGERPAVLSRGYARRSPTRDVVVVHDGRHVLESTARSGDEPQMLARRLRRVPVLVSPDRSRAGRLAETRYGASVLLLDDGFQHLQLARDVDLLVVASADLKDRVLPAGTLREPLDAARAADALVVRGTAEEATHVSAALGVEVAFSVSVRYDAPRLVSPWGAPLETRSRRIFAVAGIARPERFFRGLHERGWEVAGTRTFPDHHQFRRRDVRRIADAAGACGARLVMTTEKDAVRLEGIDPDVRSGPLSTSITWAFLPQHVIIEPQASFDRWLASRLQAARSRTHERSHGGNLTGDARAGDAGMGAR